jgi:hypothetical protein
MLKRFVLVLVFFVVWIGDAQADTVLQRVADGVNVGQIKTLQYTGNGTMFELGQHATPIAPLPRFYVKSLTRVIDFNSAAMREEVVRTQGEQSPRGGGIQPIIGEQRLIGFVHGLEKRKNSHRGGRLYAGSPRRGAAQGAESV